MGILLVQQHFDFAHDLADGYAVTDCGEIELTARGEEMVEADVRRYIAV